MFIRRVVISAAALVSAATTVSLQAQESCWQPHEVQAARVRDLQTLLMVGALECSAPGYDVAGHYNNFVSNNRTALAGHNDVLKVRFIRDRGIAEGRRAYDAFTTALANAHSGTAQATGAGFCQTAKTLAGLVQSAKPADLAALAETFAERPLGVGETCPVPGAPARSARPTVAAAVPSVTPAPAAALTPQLTALAAGNAPAPVVAESQPVPVAAAAPPAGTAPAAPTTSEALRAAALAIQSAAAALQAAAAVQPSAEAPATPAAVVPVTGPAGVVIQPEPIVPPADPSS